MYSPDGPIVPELVYQGGCSFQVPTSWIPSQLYYRCSEGMVCILEFGHVCLNL